LRFRALIDDLRAACGQISDSRQPGKVGYPLADCYLSAFALFFLQDPSLLEFQRRFQEEVQRNNLTSIFDIHTIPSDTQLRDVVDVHDCAALADVYRSWFAKLQRSKKLEAYQTLGGYYLLTLDGSEYFASEHVHCDRCLSRAKSNGHVEHYHQILQPALVRPDRRKVVPLAPEFIRRQDGTDKQDCEINAGLRAIERIRADHRQLPAVVVADALYATERFITTLGERQFSYLLGAKRESHKTLFEEIEGLRRGGYLDRLEVTTPKGQRCVYEWVHETRLFATKNAPQVNFIEFQMFDPNGKRTRHFSWVTDLPISTHTVEQLVRAARARWKIENENFNTLKNHGYHLEHNFGHGKNHLSEAFFLLNLLAFFMHQIFAMADELYQRARAGFSARREYWNAIRASLRLLLFDSWDQVLNRIHGPPQQAF
jgi:hypothetical protein